MLFLHNEGYSTMCGHAVIALGRFAVDRGLVPVVGAETEVRIQCPCGLVPASVETPGGVAGRVRFESVPAFAFARDAVVVTDTFGPVTLDIGYGGAFYAVLPASALGLDLETSPVGRLVEAAMEIKEAAAGQIPLAHPDDPDLAFLYGTILTDDADRAGRGAHDQYLRLRRRPGRPQPNRIGCYGAPGTDAPPQPDRARPEPAASAASPAAFRGRVVASRGRARILR